MPTLKYLEGGVWKQVPLVFPQSTPMDIWHVIGTAGEPAFQNSWVNMGGLVSTAAFRKYPDGKVRLRGGVKNGTIPSAAMFTLPVGYRPPADMDFAVASAGAFGRVVVEASTGNVYPQTGSNVTFYLNGVEFDTESVTALPTGPQGQPGPGMRGLVTSLPSSPADGDECYFVVDAANAIIWHLRYNAGSASAYKWEYLGGSPMYNTGTADNGSVGATTYTLDTTGPQLTLPLPGDYVFTIIATADGPDPPGSQLFHYGFGTSVVPQCEIAFRNGSGWVTSSSTFRVNGFTTTLLMRTYHKVGSGAARFFTRKAIAVPVRVG